MPDAVIAACVLADMACWVYGMHIDFGLYISVIYTTLSGVGAKIVG